MSLLRSSLRVFFRHLYHGLAPVYDLVAWAVSLGAWKAWGRASIDFVEGEMVLELGSGPGHLQVALFEGGWSPMGLDESSQMIARSAHQLRRLGYSAGLARGMAQSLPYASGSLDTIVSTFPAEYIIDGRTLEEAWRTLRPGGRMVIIPWAMRWETRWLFEITHQGPTRGTEALPEALLRAGFETESRLEQTGQGVVAVILARKPARL
jgi:ubiquinone/menaquinone biosynthesis C-methylase UbiE